MKWEGEIMGELKLQPEQLSQVPPVKLSGWALILGASYGFGAATSKRLAEAGMDIFGVHLDRKATLHMAEEVQNHIRSFGRRAIFFNKNAADDNSRKEIIESISETLKSEPEDRNFIRVLMHSIAFGTLKPYTGENRVNRKGLEMTLDVMANSLVYWVQDLLDAGLLRRGSRIFVMTSIGSQRVWPAYGPVSAAKALIEAHIRQLAYELAPMGITANSICAGVTDTPALRKIPGHEEMVRWAMEHNPSKRLTRPEDVANAIMLLSHPASYWITGNIIYVDGGEAIAG